MATGYTHPVVDGECTTLREFIIRCSNATVYDRSADSELMGPIEPDLSFYAPELVRARTDLDKYRSMSLAVAKLEMAKESAEIAKHNEEHAARSQTEVDRIDAMLLKVSDWVPPTPKHNDLKRFMLEQLKSTREWSSYGLELKPEPRPTRSPAKWLEGKIKSAEDYVTYYTGKIEEETTRTRERNEYFDALRKNLPDY